MAGFLSLNGVTVFAQEEYLRCNLRCSPHIHMQLREYADDAIRKCRNYTMFYQLL
jgi:hypothetical protein